MVNDEEKNWNLYEVNGSFCVVKRECLVKKKEEVIRIVEWMLEFDGKLQVLC